MMKTILSNLKEELLTTCDILAAINEQQASQYPAPGKWSIKEILGHLIDSAFNNQRRFILMHTQESLIFESYDQNTWVRLSGYQKRNFKEIIEQWRSINLHLIETLENFEDSFWEKEFSRHGLDKSYWKATPLSEPGTPVLFAKDYFAHMRHHIKQISEISKKGFNFGDALF